MVPLVLFALLALTSAQERIPLNKGVYERCRWQESFRGSGMFNVTCKRGEMIDTAVEDIDVRSGLSRTDSTTPQTLIYKLDVDMSDEPVTGFDINPEFLVRNLPELKIITIRGDKALSFGRPSHGTPGSKHGLESLTVINSQIYELRESLLNGFDQLTSVSFIGLNTSDVHENAIHGMQQLSHLLFQDCNIGEFEQDSISANPSLTMVYFINNNIEEFSRGSIRDVKASDDSLRCNYVTVDDKGRNTPIWEFSNNTIDKVDREAIQIDLVRELVIDGNHIKRVKSNGLEINVGSGVCPSGKVTISENHFDQLDENALFIKNKAGSNAEFAFTNNKIVYSRFSFLPQSFNFPETVVTVDGNIFSCDCENSGHSWFIPALKHVADPLHSTYKNLWNKGFCTDSSRETPMSFTDAKVDEKCHGGKLNLGDSTPDPDVTVPPTPANRHSTEAPNAGETRFMSVYSFLTMILVVKYVL